MARWTFLAILICFATLQSAAYAQGFNMAFQHFEPASPLTTTCGGNIGIPDGTVIKIFQDVDNDGPDLEDPQPVVCIDPPDCVTPFDAVNFNQFTFNGVYFELGPGYFVTETLLTCSATIPANARYYLRIYEPDGVTVLWTSSVATAVVGYQEVNYTDADWTCGASGPRCTVIDETE